MENQFKLENDDEGEFSEEEILVYAEIEPTSVSSTQIHEASCLNLVADEKKLLLQIDNKFFEGKQLNRCTKYYLILYRFLL
jgi:hypothetical protein